MKKVKNKKIEPELPNIQLSEAEQCFCWLSVFTLVAIGSWIWVSTTEFNNYFAICLALLASAGGGFLGILWLLIISTDSTPTNNYRISSSQQKSNDNLFKAAMLYSAAVGIQQRAEIIQKLEDKQGDSGTNTTEL